MKNSIYLFQSSRLGFRQWNDTDLIPFAEMNADPEVMRYFPATRSFEESEKSLQQFKKHFEQYGYCFYAVDELASKNFIGFVGLNNPKFEAGFMPCTEIGWRLRKEFWNKGYATEAAKRCLEYGFKKLNLNKIVSFTSVLNIPSENVMKKIGMRKVKHFLHPDVNTGHDLEEHVLYEIASYKKFLKSLSEKKHRTKGTYDSLKFH
ncbi:MAG TPA: GNAT family N-acetyltransferase [Salinimicrobium sp.]|nr:GNAT family N-acetyltransferase [Salinimicrobium sp.]